MSENINKCIEKLKLISTIKNELLRKKMLAILADECLYKALNEIVVNTFNGNIPLKQKQKNKLRKYKKQLNNLSRKTNNKGLRKKYIVQSGGFWPFLIPIALQTLGSLITNG